jgi:hypothetical protein
MNTQTIRIKQELDQELAKIRGYADLTDEAKRRRIAEAYEDASQRYRQAIAHQERGEAEKLARLEKRVMGIRYPGAILDGEKELVHMSYRDAYDRAERAVSRSEAGDEHLAALLERAERSGDPVLADAVYHVATERGLRGVADSYLASRPEQQKAWEKYTAARGEADDVGRQVGHALSFGLMRPPELDAYPVRAPSSDGASG